MVSLLDTTQNNNNNDHSKSHSNVDLTCSPRISFSSEFLEEAKGLMTTLPEIATVKSNKPRHVASDQHFEFVPSATTNAAADANRSFPDDEDAITADELFFEGKLLPFWQARTTERLAKLTLATSSPSPSPPDATSALPKKDAARDCHVGGNGNGNGGGEFCSNTWFVDDDPSPRPPKCTVLWKELLRLKSRQRQRASSTLSPSSSSSSSSSSASSLADAADHNQSQSQSQSQSSSKNSNGNNNNSKGSGRRSSSTLERTRSATIRIRPMINVPICSTAKTGGFGSSLPPLFPLKKGKLFDR